VSKSLLPFPSAARMLPFRHTLGKFEALRFRWIGVGVRPATVSRILPCDSFGTTENNYGNRDV
jgi:hypothetical protein